MFIMLLNQYVNEWMNEWINRVESKVLIWQKAIINEVEMI